MKIAVYTRVSTNRQMQSQSIEQQIERLQEAVTQNSDWALPQKNPPLLAGVDLGEIHIAAVCTRAGDALLLSGRALRSVKRLRNQRLCRL